MKSPLAKILLIAVVFAGSAFATHSYLRHLDASAYQAKVRQSYVEALIRDFSRDADFLTSQIENAVADSIRIEALMAQAIADSNMTMETFALILRTDLGEVVDGRNPLGFGMLHSLNKSGEFDHWSKDIQQGIANIIESHNDIRLATDHLEWVVAQNRVWKGNESASEIENETVRAWGLLALKRHSLKTLTEKRRHILAETTHLLTLLHETKS
jgi:hypothetical protein